jgi:hypothetical protein
MPKTRKTGEPEGKTSLNIGEPLDCEFRHLPSRFRHFFGVFRLNLGNLGAQTSVANRFTTSFALFPLWRLAGCFLGLLLGLIELRSS